MPENEISEVTSKRVEMQLVPIDEMSNSIRQIREVLVSKFFIKGIDYDIVPGSRPKDGELEQLMLLQAGAQKLLKRFNLYSKRITLNKNHDGSEVEFEMGVYTVGSNVFVGYGAGTASYDEEKYRWRYAVCEEEYEYYKDLDPGSVRLKFKKKWSRSLNRYDGFEKAQQVKRELGDLKHTIFMMAMKRAVVSATKSALAAGSILKTLQTYKDPPPAQGAALSTPAPETVFITEEQYNTMIALKDEKGMADDVFMNVVTNTGKAETPDSIEPKRFGAVLKALKAYNA